MEKRFSKIKNFLVKCFVDKDTNNIVFTIAYLPLLIYGLIAKKPLVYFVGGLGLYLMNLAIIKVVKRKTSKGKNAKNKIIIEGV